MQRAYENEKQFLAPGDYYAKFDNSVIIRTMIDIHLSMLNIIIISLFPSGKISFQSGIFNIPTQKTIFRISEGSFLHQNLRIPKGKTKGEHTGKTEEEAHKLKPHPPPYPQSQQFFL